MPWTDIKHFTHLISRHPPDNPIWGCYYPRFYKEGSRRLSHLPEATQLAVVGGWGVMVPRAILSPLINGIFPGTL